MTPSKRKVRGVSQGDEPTVAGDHVSWDNTLSEEEETDDEPYVDESPSVNPTQEHSIPRARPTVVTPPPTPPAEDDAYLEPGTVLGEYRVDAKIGEGGMGVVYAAVHPLIGKRAAVKVLKAELCRSRFNVERFIDEARIVNQIGHPNIVDVFAFGNTADGRSYFVMEWLKGESLRARVARSKLDLDEICDVIRPLARALEAAHEQGVIHRDLKPDNIFLVDVRGEAPLVKLLDFGIAKLAREEHRMERTATGAMVGTPQYIAPEQAKGYAIDHRVDIYSLGGILFELLTNRPPFVADNAMEMVAKHLMEPPPRPSTIAYTPPELDDLVVRMLSKDPAGRPSLAEVATVIERTSALDRTNVKTPLAAIIGPPTPPSDEIQVPASTPVPTPAPKNLAASSSPNLVAPGINPGLSAALANAMAAPRSPSHLVDATEMTDTIRAIDRRGLSLNTKILIVAIASAIALGAFVFIVLRTPDDVAPEAKPAGEPDPSSTRPSIEPIEQPPVKPVQEPPKPPALGSAPPATVPSTPAQPAQKSATTAGSSQPTPPRQVDPLASSTPPKQVAPPPRSETPRKTLRPPPPRKKEGRLEVVITGGNSPQISVDGKRVGPAATLAPGKYTLVIEDKGFKPVKTQIQIEDGGTVRKSFTLEALKKQPKEDELLQPGSLKK